MSHSGGEPPHRPKEGAGLEPLGYALAINFHPQIKLDRKKGMEFAPLISSAIDARGVKLEEAMWSFSQPLGANAASQFIVTVTESQLGIEAQFPTDREELFEHRYSVILAEFRKLFQPALILGYNALIRATLQIDGDARTFLSRDVIKFDTKRLGLLSRPVQGFGFRIVMPRFKIATDAPGPPKKAKKVKKSKKSSVIETTQWSIDLKAESLLLDPTKLFLEAVAQWQIPHKWDEKATLETVEGVASASNYLREKFIPFLLSEPSDDEP